MNNKTFSRARNQEYARHIECYPEFDDIDDDDSDEDEDEICNDGYRLDEGFGSWEEVNRMFV